MRDSVLVCELKEAVRERARFLGLGRHADGEWDLHVTAFRLLLYRIPFLQITILLVHVLEVLKIHLHCKYRRQQVFDPNAKVEDFLTFDLRQKLVLFVRFGIECNFAIFLDYFCQLELALEKNSLVRLNVLKN